MSATRERDVAIYEIVIALVLAAAIEAGVTFVLLPQPNPKPEICNNQIDDDFDGLIDQQDVQDCPMVETEQAVEVKPVLDLEGLTLKQGERMPVLPDMWGAPKPPAPAAAADKSFASTKADPDKPRDDKKPKEMADGGAEPPPDGGEAKDDSDAGPTTDPGDAGQDNELDGGSGTKGDPNGVPDGDTDDPLKANAKKTYIARVNSFLRGMWNSHCTDENATASGTITLSGRTITGVSGTGLEFLQGATIPAPPDNYPDLYFPSSSVSFSCPKKTPPP